MNESTNTSSRNHLAIAIVITLLVHSAFGGGMYAAGEFAFGSAEREVPIDVEFVEPPPKKPPEKKPEKKPEKPPEPEKELEKPPEKPPEKKVEKKVTKKRVRPRVAPTPTETKAATGGSDTPAPGPNTNNDEAAPVLKMPGLGTSGSGPLVARGRPTTRKIGTGGKGTNTGGGGGKKATGTGGPRAVSIAAIKHRAKPLNPDLDTSKLYPPEAKRLGIEGKVKVFLVVDNTGRVVRRRVTKGLGHGLDQVALKLARKLRFKPALDTDGRAVADKLEWTFTFVLPR